MTTIPDHVGREAVRLLNETACKDVWFWPKNRENINVVTVAKLLMNPPAPMTDPDEEAAKRVLLTFYGSPVILGGDAVARATEQMRKEFALRKEAWEVGR